MPTIDKKLIQKDFRIKMRFSHPGISNKKVSDGYHGTVTKLVHKENRILEITWDDVCLHDDNMKVSTDKLLMSRWNQKTPVEGAWREYLTKYVISNDK